MSYNLKNTINYRLSLLLNYIRHRVFSLPVPVSRKNTLLIIKLDSIGDYILFRNFIREIKTSETYKNYRITLCGNIWWKDIAEKLEKDSVSHFVWVDTSKCTNQNYLFKLYFTLYRKRFHTVINPTYSRDRLSDDLTFHCGAKYKIGQKGDSINLTENEKSKNDALYTQLIDINAPLVFEFERYKRFFGILLQKHISHIRPTIDIKNEIKNTVVLCPGAKHSFRQWAPENYAQLATLLEQYKFNHHEFIICGSKAEAHLAETIQKHTTVKCVDTTGRITLMELINTIASAKLVITNDSGPFHIAVALGKKTICVSNGNHYGRFNPYPENMHTDSITLYPEIIYELIKEETNISELQLKGSGININLLTVENVFNKIKPILKNA